MNGGRHAVGLKRKGVRRAATNGPGLVTPVRHTPDPSSHGDDSAYDRGAPSRGWQARHTPDQSAVKARQSPRGIAPNPSLPNPLWSDSSVLRAAIGSPSPLNPRSDSSALGATIGLCRCNAEHELGLLVTGGHGGKFPRPNLPSDLG